MEVGQRELIYSLPAFVMALVMQEEFCLRYLFCFLPFPLFLDGIIMQVYVYLM